MGSGLGFTAGLSTRIDSGIRQFDGLSLDYSRLQEADKAVLAPQAGPQTRWAKPMIACKPGAARGARCLYDFYFPSPQHTGPAMLPAAPLALLLLLLLSEGMCKGSVAHAAANEV